MRADNENMDSNRMYKCLVGVLYVIVNHAHAKPLEQTPIYYLVKKIQLHSIGLSPPITYSLSLSVRRR